MPRKAMTRDEFQRRFAEIRNKRHKRDVRGTGGAGNTLENLLGLGVDNLRKADLGFAELKVRMKDAISSVKLFTLDRDAWRMDKSQATQLYGTDSDEGKKRLYFEMRQGTITKTKLEFFSDNESVGILSPNGDVVAEWSLGTLVKTFEDKIKELVVVSAETTMGADGYDYFVYRSALHFHGISKNSVRAAFLQNVITLNLHIESITIRPDKTWKIKNRGTAFRINDDKLEKLFDHKDSL
jgi:hypothetical protein